MQTTILILIIIVILQNFINRSQIEKLKKKVSDNQIPYEHYSHLLKAYVDFSKWLSVMTSDKMGHSASTFKICNKVFEELFKEPEK